jgi:hypothetical protein
MVSGAIGANFWLNHQFGLNVQTGYKHGFRFNGRDVFQHSIGLIFTFGKVSSGGRVWGN